MLSDIAPDLRTFFVPQMQQLGLSEMPTRCGAYSETTAEWGTGWLWVMSIGDDCLISVHDLRPSCRFELSEYPTDFTCIASMSKATAAATPVGTRGPLLEENIVAFRQGAGEVTFTVEPNERYLSHTITFTPRFFKNLARSFPGSFDELEEGLANLPLNTLPTEVSTALASLHPHRANLPGADVYYTSKVMEVISLTMGNLYERAHASLSPDRERAASIALEAKRLIDTHLSEPLTLQQIADHIYVSRTRLCVVFKQETGMSVGEYLRHARMRRACELLASSDMPVSDISRTIGYTRQSSFAEAFKGEVGITPSEWRRNNRG